MRIYYNAALGTDVATDDHGVVLGIYRPTAHGTPADFRAHMKALVSD